MMEGVWYHSHKQNRACRKVRPECVPHGRRWNRSSRHPRESKGPRTRREVDCRLGRRIDSDEGRRGAEYMYRIAGSY